MWRQILTRSICWARSGLLHDDRPCAYDRDFAAQWQDQLPERPSTPSRPTPLEHQRGDRPDGIGRAKIAPDNALVSRRCSRSAPSLLLPAPRLIRPHRHRPEWIPAEKAGPNATRVLTRISEKTLRVGLPGAFTYDGFHNTVLPLIPEVAATAALDQQVFAGGCAESSDASVATLEADILKLYQDDFIAQWNGFLRDIRLAPITDLPTATANMKDLASLTARPPPRRAVVDEVDPRHSGRRWRSD